MYNPLDQYFFNAMIKPKFNNYNMKINIIIKNNLF